MQCMGPNRREDESNLEWNDGPNSKWNETYPNAI